jgi:hypothetical protein
MLRASAQLESWRQQLAAAKARQRMAKMAWRQRRQRSSVCTEKAASANVKYGGVAANSGSEIMALQCASKAWR